MDSRAITLLIGLEATLCFGDRPYSNVSSQSTICWARRGLLRMTCITCSAYQQSAQLSCQETLVWRKVPSYFFGSWCYKTQCKRLESAGDRLVSCKDRSNIAKRADNLRPDTKPIVSLPRADTIWLTYALFFSSLNCSTRTKSPAVVAWPETANAAESATRPILSAALSLCLSFPSDSSLIGG